MNQKMSPGKRPHHAAQVIKMILDGGTEVKTLGKAIKFAVDAHGDTTRKGKNRLYILHPLEAMTIVASLTEKEEVLAAAVLHDVVEDTDVTEAELRGAFGDRVANLVMAESEDKMRDIPPEASWEARKQATIDHLAGLERDNLIVAAQ